MALSWIKIANFALSKLGAKSITSFGDGTKNSNACDLLLDQAIDDVLVVEAWNCATKRAELTQDASTPIGDDWDYYYDLPVDPYCLKVIELIDSDSEYLIEGRKILCNDDELSIKYIGRITDPTHFSPYLIDTLAARLAYKLANYITEPTSGLGARMYSEYEAALLKARWHNAQEQYQEDSETVWTTR